MKTLFVCMILLGFTGMAHAEMICDVTGCHERAVPRDNGYNDRHYRSYNQQRERRDQSRNCVVNVAGIRICQ